MTADVAEMLDYRPEWSQIAKLRSTLVVRYPSPGIHTRQQQRAITMDRRTT